MLEQVRCLVARNDSMTSWFYDDYIYKDDT